MGLVRGCAAIGQRMHTTTTRLHVLPIVCVVPSQRPCWALSEEVLVTRFLLQQYNCMPCTHDLRDLVLGSLNSIEGATLTSDRRSFQLR